MASQQVRDGKLLYQTHTMDRTTVQSNQIQSEWKSQ